MKIERSAERNGYILCLNQLSDCFPPESFEFFEVDNRFPLNLGPVDHDHFDPMNKLPQTLIGLLMNLL